MFSPFSISDEKSGIKVQGLKGQTDHFRDTKACRVHEFDEGVVPVLILSRIVRVWRQIFVGKVLEGRALPGEIAKAASVPPWKAATFVKACKRFQWKGVVEGFEILIRADRAFKTSSPNPEFYFDAMVWKLMR